MKKVIIANIRYADDIDELAPLFKEGIQYVKRHGDNSIVLNELDYDKVTFDGKKFVDEYGYAPLGKELPKSFFNGKDIEFIDTEYYTQAKKNGDI